MHEQDGPNIQALIEELKRRKRDIRNAARSLKPVRFDPSPVVQCSRLEGLTPEAELQLQYSRDHFNAIDRALRTLGISDIDGHLKTTLTLTPAAAGTDESASAILMRSFVPLMGELVRFIDQFSIFFRELQALPLPEGVTVDENQMMRLQEIRAILKPPKKPRQVARLDVPLDATWDSVIIRFISNDATFIRAGKKPLGVKNFQELGFADARRGGKFPTKLWVVLNLFAKGNGEIPLESLDDTEKDLIRKRISDLSKTLKAAFGIPDNPFHHFHKHKSYKSKFIISEQCGTASSTETDEYRSDLDAYHEELKRKYPKDYEKGIAEDVRGIRSSKKPS